MWVVLPRRQALIRILQRRGGSYFSRRRFSSDIPVIGAREKLKSLFSDPKVGADLKKQGFYMHNNFLGSSICHEMRKEAISLREAGRFTQSMSHMNDGRQFPKPGVYACEPNRDDWGIAPHLICYANEMVRTLPRLANEMFPGLQIAENLFASKLAVAEADGAKYPKHVDNGGLPDTRKLTCIYYLNPTYKKVRYRLSRWHTCVYG